MADRRKRPKMMQEIAHAEWILDAHYATMLLGVSHYAMAGYLGVSEFGYRAALVGKPLPATAPADLPQRVERLKAIVRKLADDELKTFGRSFALKYTPKNRLYVPKAKRGPAPAADGDLRVAS